VHTIGSHASVTVKFTVAYGLNHSKTTCSSIYVTVKFTVTYWQPCCTVIYCEYHSNRNTV